MADGLFLVGTDRGVGKTILGVGLVALLREQGVDATLLTPISTGGSVESAAALLRQIGVTDDRRLLTPITFETPAAPYVASLVEHQPIDVQRIHAAYGALREAGKFVVVEGGGLLVPIARNYAMVDLLKELDLPSLVVGRTGRGTLNHCLLTLRMMGALGLHPLGVVLNGFGQYGDGFAESLNPDVLTALARPFPVLATLEWRPAYQENIQAFIRALQEQPALTDALRLLAG